MVCIRSELLYCKYIGIDELLGVRVSECTSYLYEQATCILVLEPTISLSLLLFPTPNIIDYLFRTCMYVLKYTAMTFY